MTSEVWLDTAVRVAQQAGERIMEYYRAEVAVHIKDGDARNLVTDADLAADEMIGRALHAAFPEHAILSEEGYRPGDLLDESVPTWVVDPIDGTSNFAHRLPLFAVSIGLRQAGRWEVGVVHAPALGWTFAGAAGRGATLNGVPLLVSQRRSLESSIVACDWSRRPALRALSLGAFASLGERAHTMRSMGSAALGLAAVAAGWVDAYFNFSLSPWDVAAGELLVDEAGGRTTMLNGAPPAPIDGSRLATNSLLHETMVSAMAPFLPEADR